MERLGGFLMGAPKIFLGRCHHYCHQARSIPVDSRPSRPQFNPGSFAVITTVIAGRPQLDTQRTDPSCFGLPVVSVSVIRNNLSRV